MKSNIITGLLFAFLISALLSSCATTKVPDSQVSPVYITNTKKFYLLSPSAIEKDVECQQVLNGKFGESAFLILAYTKADSNGIFLYLFNTLGTGMGSLNYDGIKVSFDSNVFPKKLKAEYIVADLQFAYYRLEEIQKSLSQLGLTVKEETVENKKTRTISSGKQIIEEITFENNIIMIKNLLRNYSYELTGIE